MDDDQIEALKELLAAGVRLAVCFGREYREILSIEMRKETHEGPEGLEPAGVFANGEYASLWAERVLLQGVHCGDVLRGLRWKAGSWRPKSISGLDCIWETKDFGVE